MTITAINPVPVELSEHDGIVGDHDDKSALLPAADSLPLSVGVTLHVRSETPLLARVHERDQRIVLMLGTRRAELDVFLDADQVDRLINVLTVARTRLRTV